MLFFGSPRGAARLRCALLLLVLAGCADATGPGKVATIEVGAPDGPVEVGGTVQLTATARDARGKAVPGVELAWSSSDDAVATVGTGGLVSAKGVGTATVTASAGGKSGSTTVTVVPVAVASVSVAPDTATLQVGETRKLTATLRDAAGAELDGRTVAWTSSDEAVASVGADGTVTARSAGTATVTAESEGKKGTATLTVVRGPLPELALERVAPEKTVSPAASHLVSPPGDSRLFVVGVAGKIEIIQGGQALAEPFLDLSQKVWQEVEMGLFSLVFHPRYASNGYFYVNYTDKDGNLRIERYTASGDPNRADPASVKLILSIPHPLTKEHYGGQLEFGPDGKLYVGVGDGGHGYEANAQSKGTLLGKILRIDVDGGDPYAVPPDNPFVGEEGARGEIWAIGLRNPWRMSFDPAAGLLYVGDVGEIDWEEISVVPAGEGGLNYGWPRLEGSHCYPVTQTSCDRTGLVLPVLEYPHSGRPGEATSSHPAGCSVTGGYVYRGSRMPGLHGHYFYGDFCKGWVRSFRYENGEATEQREWPFENMALLVSFGRDAAGELYLLPHTGKVYRIVPAGGS